MGKTGIANSSGHYLNNLNPASYHDMDSISFFFDFGLGMDFVKYETSYDTQHGQDFNIKDIAMGYQDSEKLDRRIRYCTFQHCWI